MTTTSTLGHLRSVEAQTNSAILKRIPFTIKLRISAIKLKTAATVKNVFAVISSGFFRWAISAPIRSTPATEVEVYELKKNSTFEEMFGFFDRDLHSLTLTKNQIAEFCQRYPDLLSAGLTFFLFKKKRWLVKTSYYVADVYVHKNGLHIHDEEFISPNIWPESCNYRVVVKGK